jgi:hypothetical protein
MLGGVDAEVERCATLPTAALPDPPPPVSWRNPCPTLSGLPLLVLAERSRGRMASKSSS